MLNDIITSHLTHYDKTELRLLVDAGRTTFEELTETIVYDLNKTRQNELLGLMQGITMKEYIVLIKSIPSIVLSNISQ